MKSRIAIVVQGRFYAFDLAKALLARGHDVRLFTNYPKWAVARFGFPGERVTSFWSHGVATRGFLALSKSAGLAFPERRLHESFGRWAAAALAREKWDEVFCFSGVAEELFRSLNGSGPRRWLVRASSHIRAQAGILEEEERRAGVPIDRPSAWIIAREEREYALADAIVVLSGFARDSFAVSGVAEKVRMIPLGVSVEDFRPTPETIDARVRRITGGAKLRVLYVGTKSFRKGIVDLAKIADGLDGRFELRCVGAEEPHAAKLLHGLRGKAKVLPPVPQAELPGVYAWADLFVFPTIEDGFPVVLAQAQASGLPILATANCSAPDFVREDEAGWILPVRAPGAFIERLEWCDTHRAELAGMVRLLYDEFKVRTWDDMARDYEEAIANGYRNAESAEVRA